MSRSPEERPPIDEKARRLHDLRQPLAAILVAATAMQQMTAADATTRDRFLTIIVDNAERLSEMLDAPGAHD